MKKRRSILSIFAILLLPVLLFSGCQSYDDDADQLLRAVDVQAEVLENGNMHITERWDITLYDRGRDYSNLFKSFPYSDEQQITDFSVTDNESGETYTFEGEFRSLYELSEEPGTCYLIQNGSETEIGWFMPPVEEGNASFTLSYTVTNAIERYDDVGVLYYGFIGSEFSIPIKSFSAEISLPEGASQQELRGWLHCASASSSFLEIQSGSQITLTAEEIPAGTFLETRGCAPASLFPDASRVSSGQVLEQIAAEEQQWAEEWEAAQARERLFAILSVVAAAVMILAGLALGIFCKIRKRRHKVESPEYYREIPEGSSPGGAASLYYYYNGGINNSKTKSNVAAATLMSLARKGWIAFEDNPYGSATKDKDDDILIRVGQGGEPLTPSEQSFYGLLADAACEHPDNGMTLEDFESYAKHHPRKYQDDIQKFVNLCRNEIAPKGFFENELVVVKLTRVLAVLCFILAFVLFAISDGTLVVISAGLFIGALLALILSSGTPRLSVKGETELGLWNGLKQFMLDFSNMKEYGVFQLPLWEEYLVYAAMMGISEEVMEQLQKAYPQVWTPNEGEPVYFPRTSYLYWMYHPMYHRHTSYPFCRQLSHTMENAGRAAQNAIDAMQRKSSGGRGIGGSGFGGGGFGGGGGGFGSGGGGGAR